MRFPRWAYGLSVGLWSATVALTAALYDRLPEPLAVHWNWAGEPDGFLPRLWGAWLVPGLMLGLAVLLFGLVPRLEPWPRNLQAFRREYAAFVVGLLALLAGVQIWLLAWGLGWRGDGRRWLAVLFTLLNSGLAWILPRTRPNWFFGIRTPWTLSDPQVWALTHRLARPVFGLAAVLSALAIAWPSLLPLAIVGLLVAALGLAVESWRRYRARQRLA